MSSFNHVSADAKEKNENVREGERESERKVILCVQPMGKKRS